MILPEEGEQAANDDDERRRLSRAPSTARFDNRLARG
jgi:hypothetical protein